MKSAAGQMPRLFCFWENRCRWDAVYFTLTTVLLFLPFSFPYNNDLLCRICFRLGNGYLLTPLLRLLSQVSLLLWVSPTSDKPSGSPFARLKSPLPCFRSLSDLPGMQILLCTLATLSDPNGTYDILAYRLPYYCLRPRGRYQLPLYITYGAVLLHAFALRLSCSTTYA